MVSQLLGPCNHFHLEGVPPWFDLWNNTLQNFPLVQSKTTCQIACSRVKHRLGHKIGHARSQLSIEIPAVNATPSLIPRSRHNITIGLILLWYELRDEFGVMWQVSVHQNDKSAATLGYSVDVSRTQPQLSRSFVQYNLVFVDLLESSNDVLSSIRGVVINNHNLQRNVLFLRSLE